MVIITYNKWMTRWLTDWMIERMDEWINEWLVDRMNKWTNKWIKKWINALVICSSKSSIQLLCHYFTRSRSHFYLTVATLLGLDPSALATALISNIVEARGKCTLQSFLLMNIISCFNISTDLSEKWVISSLSTGLTVLLALNGMHPDFIEQIKCDTGQYNATGFSIHYRRILTSLSFSNAVRFQHFHISMWL